MSLVPRYCRKCGQSIKDGGTGHVLGCPPRPDDSRGLPIAALQADIFGPEDPAVKDGAFRQGTLPQRQDIPLGEAGTMIDVAKRIESVTFNWDEWPSVKRVMADLARVGVVVLAKEDYDALREAGREQEQELGRARVDAELQAALDECAKLRAQLALVRTPRDLVWQWQGDGCDEPSSLICAVVMSADTLRELLAPVDELRALVRELRPLHIRRSDRNISGAGSGVSYRCQLCNACWWESENDKERHSDGCVIEKARAAIGVTNG